VEEKEIALEEEREVLTPLSRKPEEVPLMARATIALQV
jgi:hypothetical protein